MTKTDYAKLIFAILSVIAMIAFFVHTPSAYTAISIILTIAMIALVYGRRLYYGFFPLPPKTKPFQMGDFEGGLEQICPYCESPITYRVENGQAVMNNPCPICTMRIKNQ